LNAVNRIEDVAAALREDPAAFQHLGTHLLRRAERQRLLVLTPPPKGSRSPYLCLSAAVPSRRGTLDRVEDVDPSTKGQRDSTAPQVSSSSTLYWRGSLFIL
jgi:hypothetical protein